MKIKEFFKSKMFKNICAIALGLVLIAGSVLGTGFYLGWFNTSNEIEDTGSGFMISDTVNNGISLSTAAVQESGTYNSKTYESYIEVTGTVTPSDATNTSISWSLEWSSTSSSTLSDYVVLSSSSSTSGDSIIVYCYGAFSTSIILTATADGSGSSDVTSSATLLYVKRLTDAACNLALLYQGNTNVVSSASFSGNSSSATFALPEWDSTLYSPVSTSSSYYFYITNNSNYTLTYGTGCYQESYTITSYSCEGNTGSSSTFYLYYFLYYKYGIDVSKESNINSLISAIEADNEIDLSVTFTGNTTGLTYTFDYTVELDASALYTNVTAVELTDTSFYF